ncbi:MULTISPECIES: TetR/AcrR family transcriptional regulator [unclassified Sphingomonas]|uniref:TetR/AcrR family transcriptional regulator n=1 Tax=unclassified Sphingomonas TaxID=196159 RepID=UPI00083032F8|nr:MULTISPECIES: TetR/AcrR family transcriptional regulator [unclassified Sphingomonas]MCH4893638.1 TetR family transcriptional regulator [Sphingomonas sp. SFZ2018-12]
MKRGRPRQYDATEVLRRARDCFWAKGYSGTTVDALCEATKLSKPSLYAGFGSKLNLYLMVLRDYEIEGQAALAESLASRPDLRGALRVAAAGAVRNFTGDGEVQRGCLLIGTAAVEAMSETAVRDFLHESMSAMTELFAARIARAVEEEGLVLGAGPLLLGRVMCDAVYGAALRARAGEPAAALLASLEPTIDFVCDSATSR